MDDAAPRLDQWLWFARHAKTRGVARDLCAGGCVRLNGAVVSRGQRKVRIGDRIEVFRDPVWCFVTVLALADRRLGAEGARALYAESRPPLRLSPGDDRPTPGNARLTAPMGSAEAPSGAVPRNDLSD